MGCKVTLLLAFGLLCLVGSSQGLKGNTTPINNLRTSLQNQINDMKKVVDARAKIAEERMKIEGVYDFNDADHKAILTKIRDEMNTIRGLQKKILTERRTEMGLRASIENDKTKYGEVTGSPLAGKGPVLAPEEAALAAMDNLYKDGGTEAVAIGELTKFIADTTSKKNQKEFADKVDVDTTAAKKVFKGHDLDKPGKDTDQLVGKYITADKKYVDDFNTANMAKEVAARSPIKTYEISEARNFEGLGEFDIANKMQKEAAAMSKIADKCAKGTAITQTEIDELKVLQSQATSALTGANMATENAIEMIHKFCELSSTPLTTTPAPGNTNQPMAVALPDLDTDDDDDEDDEDLAEALENPQTLAVVVMAVGTALVVLVSLVSAAASSNRRSSLGGPGYNYVDVANTVEATDTETNFREQYPRNFYPQRQNYQHY